MKYRKLKEGEIIQEGDGFLSWNKKTNKAIFLKIHKKMCGRKFDIQWGVMIRPTLNSIDFMTENI